MPTPRVSLDVLPVVGVPSRTTATTMDAWLAEAAASDEALAQLREANQRHDQSKKNRHAPGTRDCYDRWWNRFTTWCAEPDKRLRGRALPAADPAMIFDPTDPRGQSIFLLWVYELVYGPDGLDEQAETEWRQEYGWLSPNTLTVALAAIAARVADELRIDLVLTSEAATALDGCRRYLREHYGPDVRATPLLGTHLRTIIRWLKGAVDPVVVRDRLLLELAAVGVNPAETARIKIADLLEAAPGVHASTADANEQIWQESGGTLVGCRSLVVPGARSANGKPARLLTLMPGAPLTAAVEAWLAVRGTDTSPDPALIDGLGTSNPRSQIRKQLLACAEAAIAVGWGTWRPARNATVPDDASLAGCRRWLDQLDRADHALRQRDIAMVWIGWLCALRRAELVALNVGHLRDRGDRIGIHIAQSKTDQDKTGITLPIREPRTVSDLSPLSDIRAWLDVLAVIHGYRSADELPDDTPLFPALNRAGQIYARTSETDDGDVVVTRYDRLSDATWSDRLRDLAGRSGAISGAALDCVTGHSLRRGYVTTAALAGKSALVIRRRTRHSDLNALAVYVEQVQLEWGDDDLGAEELIVDLDAGTDRSRSTYDQKITGAAA